MTIVDFLIARLDEDGQRASRPTFCSPVWPSTDQILADIAIKRRLLNEIFDYEHIIDGEWGCLHTAEQIRNGECYSSPLDENQALRLLASVYDDHPDYREEWRP